MKLAWMLSPLLVLVAEGSLSKELHPAPPPGFASPDLVLENVEIYAFPPDHEVPSSKSGRLELHQYRSYRVILTIQNRSTVVAPPFNVAVTSTLTGVGGDITVRNGGTKILGKARVGDLGRGRIYACMDVFPGEAVAGEHDLLFVVDSDHEVNESDESPLSNVRRQLARFVAPK